MVLKYFRSGLDFLVDQTVQQRDWISYLQMAPSTARRHSGADLELQIPDPSQIHSLLRNYATTSTSSLSSHPSTSSIESALIDLASLSSKHNSPIKSNDTEWRFWKWLPPSARQRSSMIDIEDYGTLMTSFKDYLHASEAHAYTVNELKQFSTLELAPIIGYVNDASTCEELEKGIAAATIPAGGMIRSYYIFKDGVRPLWEDEYNAAGGCWNMRITSQTEPPQVFWKLLIKILTDERMKPYLDDEICGAGLTVRANTRGFWSYKISVWNRNADNTIVKMMIGHVLKSLVACPGRLFYYSHRTNMQHQLLQQPKQQLPQYGNNNNKRKMQQQTTFVSNKQSPIGNRNKSWPSQSNQITSTTPAGGSSSKKVTFLLPYSTDNFADISSRLIFDFADYYY